MNTRWKTKSLTRSLAIGAVLLLLTVAAMVVAVTRGGGPVDTVQPERKDQMGEFEANDASEELVLIGIMAEDPGDRDDFDLAVMEDQLIEIVDGGSLGEVDGSGTDLETGASEIYIYGPSADVIMQAIRPVLEVWSRDGLVVDVTIRRGPTGAELETLSIG
jgi:hypothetical protein